MLTAGISKGNFVRGKNIREIMTGKKNVQGKNGRTSGSKPAKLRIGKIRREDSTNMRL